MDSRPSREVIAAGHRIDREHDCFLMNCKDLGPEVASLRRQIAKLDRAYGELQDRLREAVMALDGACHDRSGLGCEADPCVENVSRADVLALLAQP